MSFIEQRERELRKINAGFVISRKMDNSNYEISNSILNSLRLDRQYQGIYEAHSRGVCPEEIAQYLDKTVEYVNDCIKHVSLLEYSRRTGNAIISKIPEE